MRFVTALALCLSACLVAAMGAIGAEEDTKLKSHLTLYVGEPLLTQGGTVVVASIPIPEAEWRELQGTNLAANDPENRKRASLEEGDVLFGAAVNARTSFVELYYPEGGTFGFDFVPLPSIQNPPKIQSERILVGSGGWTHWESGTDHVWPDVSTIFVKGSKADEKDPRTIRASQSRIMNLTPPSRRYQGAIVHEPTPEQVSEGTFGEVK